MVNSRDTGAFGAGWVNTISSISVCTRFYTGDLANLEWYEWLTVGY